MSSVFHKIAALLMFALIAAAIMVVHQNHLSRRLTTAIAKEQSEEHRLETAYRQMQLERAQWSAASRVEKISREQLKMQFPDATRTIHLGPVGERTSGAAK
jgi:cell division protein FtsL